MEQLNAKFPCRGQQIQALSTLFAQSFPTPPALVVHGLSSTGKSAIVEAVAEQSGTPFAIIQSRECITARHLLEKAASVSAAACRPLLGDAGASAPQRCENVNSLAAHLERILRQVPKLILVFDGIDKQRETQPTLIPGLARLGSIIPRLSIVLIISVPTPRLLHASGVPHVHFQPYTRDESVKALSLDPPLIFLRPVDASYDYGDEEHMEDRRWLWQRYCEVVWDSVGKGAARDLVTFRSVCYKLWRPFVQPIVDGQIGTRDFSRLVVSKRALFQNEEILSGIQLDGPKIQANGGVSSNELPYFSKFLLCGAYLASYNPARLDATYFMKATERKRRKRGGAAGKPSKHRKIPRRLLKPAPFPLDRLLAIVHSLVPQPMQQTNLIYAQIATLTSLRLLQRTGSANADPLDPGSKLRVNCSWEFVASLGRSVGLEMRDYLAG